jgi:HD-GYP domain-containing protein (c-di-GMP phosphodiesterase class II)
LYFFFNYFCRAGMTAAPDANELFLQGQIVLEEFFKELLAISQTKLNMQNSAAKLQQKFQIYCSELSADAEEQLPAAAEAAPVADESASSDQAAASSEAAAAAVDQSVHAPVESSP